MSARARTSRTPKTRTDKSEPRIVVREFCEGVTKKGTPCGNKPKTGEKLCTSHLRAASQRPWQERWLDAFRRTGLVTRACEEAGVGRSTVYEERQRNEDFALAWHDIEEETTEAMEREAYRRAVEGVEKPMVSAGKLVTTAQEYSDTLLIFMLKARRPDKYRDNVHVQHSGTIRSENVEIPNDDQRKREVAGILDEAGALS